MAVTFVPDFSIQQGIASIGEALGKNLLQGRQRELAIRNNPELAMQVAQMTRAARRSGGEQALINQLGIGSEFLVQNEQAFPETPQETQTRRSVELGLPELLAEAKTLETMVQADTFDAQIAQEIPFVRAVSERAQLEAAESQSIYNKSVFDLKTQEDLATLQVDFEKAKLRFDKFGYEVQEDNLRNYVDFFNSMDTSTRAGRHMKQMAMLAMANPSFAQHIQFHENMDFQMSIRKLASSAGANPMDQFAAWVKIQSEVAKSRDRLDEIKNDRGVPEGEAQAVRDYHNALQQFALAMEEQGWIPQGFAQGHFALPESGKSKDRDTLFEKAQKVISTRASDALRMVFDGTVTYDELRAHPVWGQLSTEDKREINTAVGLAGLNVPELPSTAVGRPGILEGIARFHGRQSGLNLGTPQGLTQMLAELAARRRAAGLEEGGNR